jgi:hypothetical protein
VEHEDETHQKEDTVATDDQAYPDKDRRKSNQDIDMASHSDNDVGEECSDLDGQKEDQDHQDSQSDQASDFSHNNQSYTDGQNAVSNREDWADHDEDKDLDGSQTEEEYDNQDCSSARSTD